MVDVDIGLASWGRGSLEPLLSSGDPNWVVSVDLLTVLRSARSLVVVVFHQDGARGLQLASLVGTGGEGGGSSTGFGSSSLGFTSLFLQKSLRNGIGRALELLQTSVEDSGVCWKMIVGTEMSLCVHQFCAFRDRQVSRQVETGGHLRRNHLGRDHLGTGDDVLHLVLDSGDDFN